MVSNDTPPSVRGPRNGQVLVGKIRDLQRQLEQSEKENATMKTQIKDLQDHHQQQQQQQQQRHQQEQRQQQQRPEPEQGLKRLPEDPTEDHERRMSTNTLQGSDDDDSMTSDNTNTSADETIVQGALSQIQSGVYQLEKSLRRLSKGGASFQKELDLGGSTGCSTAASSSTTPTFPLGDVFCGHGTPLWWSRLECGDMVDGRDKDRAWYAACVESIETCENEMENDIENGTRSTSTPVRVLISFQGWSSDWDIWVHSKRDIAELAPRGTHVRLSSVEEEAKAMARRQNQHTHQKAQSESSSVGNGLIKDEEEGEEDHDDAHNVSDIPTDEDDEEDGVDLSRGSTQVGNTPQRASSLKSWGGSDGSLSPVEYVHSLGGSSSRRGSMLRHEMLVVLPGDEGRRGRGNAKEQSVKSWRVRDVVRWVRETLELPQYVAGFQEGGVDGMVLCKLARLGLKDLLKELGIGNRMHGLKVMSHLEELVGK